MTLKQAGKVDLDLEALAYLYSRVPFQIQRVDQITTALFLSLQSQSAITASQLQMLWLLDAQGPLMQTDLSNLAGTDKSTTGLVLANLMKRHLVEREVDAADRRRKLATITEKGRSTMRAARATLAHAERTLLDPLRPAERTRLLHLLGTVVNRAPLDDSSPVRKVSVSWLLRRCLQIGEAALSQEAGLFGLTLRQFTTLYVVFTHPGIGEPLIRRLLGYEVTNASLVIGLLRSKGLLEFTANSTEGRRRYRITLMGRDVLASVEPKLSSLEMEFVKDIDQDDTTQLQLLLGRLIAAHGDKVKTPLEPFDDVQRSSSWPVHATANYTSTNADALWTRSRAAVSVPTAR